MPERFAIIVAGGSGSRMGSTTPKQFLSIRNRPILMYTLEVFYRYDPAVALVLVLPENHIGSWNKLCLEQNFNIRHQVVAGGVSRFQSVKNGLAVLPDKGLVAVHDGVRPFVAQSVIKESFEVAAREGSAIASLPLKESIREWEGASGRSVSRDRSKFRLIQTPQTFQIALLKSAYEQMESSVFTDDASVVESSGKEVQLIEGNEENIKITHQMDLVVAEALAESKKSPL